MSRTPRTRPARPLIVTTLTLLGALTLLILPLPAQQGEGDNSSAAEHRPWSAYRETIVVGNIFSRQRGQRRADENRAAQRAEERTREPEPEPEPIDPGDTFALRGVSDIGGVMHAFFEDLEAGGIRTVVVDQTLGERRVTAITLDSVQLTLLPDEDGDREYEPLNEGDYAIRIGWMLSGRESAPAAVRRSETRSRGSSNPSSRGGERDRGEDAEEAADDEEELSVEERLRRRRERQLND